MLPFNLAIAAAVFLLLYLITGLIQALRRQVRIGCWSNFLVVMAILLFIASFIVSIGVEEQNPLTLPITLGSLAVFAVVSVIIYFLERRSDNFSPMFSRAILGIGVAAVIAVSYFITPIIPASIIQMPTSTPVAEIVLNSGNSAENSNIIPTEVAGLTPTATIIIQPTLTKTPLSSPSPTRTRRAYVPPTITPTPQVAQVSDECDALVLTNLNVRSEPTTDSDIVAIIPQGRLVSLLGKNSDATWWRTVFEDQQGWVSTDFIELDPICQVE